MDELIPFMLIILGWLPEQPQDIDVQRIEVVYLTQQDCERDGAAIAARMRLAAVDKSGAQYSHRCLKAPAPEELDEAFERAMSAPR